MEILEEEFGYPQTNFSNFLNKFFEQYSIFSKRNLKPDSKEYCWCKALEFVKYSDFHTELIHDSSDWPIIKRDNKGKKSKHHSYKLNSHGIRYQYSVSNDLRIQFVSKRFKYKTFDSNCMIKINDLFHSKFKGKWSVLADGYYTLLSTI